MVYILTDMEYNNIVLYFFNSSVSNTDFLNAVEPFHLTIFYFDEETPQKIIRARNDVDNSKREISTKLLDGEGLYNNANGYLCSAGFWAMSRDEPMPLYIITTGHCINQTSHRNDFYYVPWNWDWNTTKSNLTYIGPMIFHNRDQNPDFSIIQVDGEDVFPSFAIRNTDNDQYKEFIITNDAPVSNQGVHICKSGYTSHFSCRFVKGLNGIFIHEENYTSGLIVTDLHAERGDSGGPVMSFISPHDLNSVILHSIHVGGGAGLAVANSIEIIFKELEEESSIRRLEDLVLYLGNS
ncbi:S1 family peptidase [Gigaspora margarita]|uniref:S1 family peptidase n=1 Tax=Gigaspora margarita TaxID=4874 RepID=A0A8H4B4Q4_GIGMA|nr:S1 family peptidase [Gigaspora margarita]